MFKKVWNTNCILAILLILFSSNPYASAAVPGPPAGLTAIAGNSEASLTWGAVPDATRYALYRGTASGGPYSFVAETQGTGYADHGLGNGSTYYYVVTALNADGQSSYSSQVNVTPNTTVLPAPTGLTTVPGNGEVSLSWNPVTSAVSYNIYRATARGGPYTLLSPTAPGPSFTDKGLTNSTPYFYVVQTMSTNAGAYSDEVYATPSSLLPVAPATFTVTPGSTWASLSWSASDGATAYLVYRGTKTGGPYSFAALPNTNTYEDTGLPNGTTYYYVVAAVNANGRSAFSAEAGVAVSANEKPHAAVLTALSFDKSVWLSWSGSFGAISYTVYRSTTSSGPYTDLGIKDSIYSDTGLSNGTTYYYVVDAHNASITVARSNEVAVTPAIALPAPTNVAVTPGNTQATVTWDPVPGAANYKVFVATSPGGEAISISDFLSGPSYNAAFLTNGQPYYFRVQSSGGSWSAYSAEVNTTPLGTLPLAPTNLIATPGNTQLSLTWTAVSGATGYKVYRKTEGSAWSSAPIGSPTATLFTDTELTNGMKYYYSIAAVNADGTGAWSYETSGTPTAVALPAPTNVAVTPGNTQATVTWDPVPGAANYKVFVATSPGGEAISISDFLSGPSYNAAFLTNGQPYYFRVQSSGISWSAYSTEVNATPLVTLPLAPTNLIATPGNTQLSLTWAAVTGATGYEVYRRTEGNAWLPAPIGSPTATLFTDTGLTNETKYYYNVAAVNVNGTGARSDETSGTPTAGGTVFPVNIAVTPGNQQATVTWDPVAGATSYTVTVAESPGGTATGSSGNTTGSFFTAIGLNNGQTYYFRVQAVGNQVSPFSAEVSAIPNPAANIANISGRVSVNVAGYNDLGVRNATVSLQGTGYTASPDANGNFTLLNIPFGNYSLVVTAPGMDAITQEVSLTEQNLQVAIPTMVVSQVTGIQGDANGDNFLGIDDVVYILQVLTGARQ